MGYNPYQTYTAPSVDNYKANFAPSLSFTGNAPKVKNAYIITGEKQDIPLLITQKNNSYVIEFDSQTELIYGEDAIKYLNDKKDFSYDTQVIFPKKACGSVESNGEIIPCPENSAVMINAGTKAKVETGKGYPMVLITKKDFDWYERYSKDAHDQNIKNKFLELIYYNSHLYNGEFTPNVLLSENLLDEKYLKSIGIEKYKSANYLVYDLYNKRNYLPYEEKSRVDFAKNLLDKLYEKDIIEQREDGYIRFKYYFTPDYEKEYLKEQGFSEDEIKALLPVSKQARQVKIDSRAVLRNSTASYAPKYVTAMKEKGLLHNNTDNKGFIYWKKMYANRNDFESALKKAGFNEGDVKAIAASYEKENICGFDISGLKFINEDLAVYNLNDKLNNWTHEKTNWVTNSTALSSINGDTPFIGASIVQYDKEETIPISKIRKEEKLHSHPNLDEKRQTEIYLITSGAAALNVVKNGKSSVQLLKEGDLAIVGPGVLHCVNSIMGEYEHIVTQVPSAFQYGFGFKSVEEPPADYNQEKLERQAISGLYEMKNSAKYKSML